ncbi:energy transducer TonB [candidate division KSB1 bacterium]|nr:energy transducer TonB [candidate division KSB1 bacterium]
MKTRQPFSLVLKIRNNGKIDQRVVSEKDGFSIGQKEDNDLILFGHTFPKRHTLISKKNGNYQLFLPAYVKEGELREGDSALNLRDLMIHDVLPRTKNSYIVKLTPKKFGYLTIGDTRIEFGFDKKQIMRHRQQQQRMAGQKFSGYSWLQMSAKDLFSDMLFKFIVLLLFALNTTVLYMFKDYEIKVKEVNVEKVQQRLTKFMIKTPEQIEALTDNKLTSNLPMEDQGAENKGKEDAAKKRTSTKKKASGSSSQRRGNAVASSGLLGLIGGTGSSSKSSGVVDALVDRGLVADLNSMLGGGTNLKVGRSNTKDKDDPLDQLIGTGGSGGIDDFLGALDEPVETVTLKKQVRVNLAQATQKSGDEEALGARSDASVMAVVQARMGRITYYYEKYLKANPSLSGKVTVRFTIAANGFVTDVKVVESTINHPQLENDIVNLVKRLKFDPIPSGVAHFVFPFHFKKIQ